jgi:hypothetical protein
MRLAQFDLNKFLLLTRGFNWVQEYPLTAEAELDAVVIGSGPNGLAAPRSPSRALASRCASMKPPTLSARLCVPRR